MPPSYCVIPHCEHLPFLPYFTLHSLKYSLIGSLDESVQLQDAVERTLEQKQTLEAQATQQVQSLGELERARKELDTANKTLTARVETLEREARMAHITVPATSSNPSAEEIAARKKLEEQLAQTMAELDEAKDELARISMAESSQRM